MQQLFTFADLQVANVAKACHETVTWWHALHAAGYDQKPFSKALVNQNVDL